MEGCTIATLSSCIRNPEKFIRGPRASILQLWDDLASKRRMIGLGALDNHAANFPLRKCRWKLLKVFPHEQLFRTVRTHVLVPPPAQKSHEDIDSFLQAMARGRCFIDYAPLGDGTGFRFWAECSGSVFLCGDELPAGQPAVFRATVPCPAEIILVKDNSAAAVADGQSLEHCSDGSPGVYRVEARRNGQPWLFSNHIYVRKQTSAA